MILKQPILISGKTTITNLFTRYVLEQLAPFAPDILLAKNWTTTKYQSSISNIVSDAILMEGIRNSQEILKYIKTRISFTSFTSFI